MTQRETFLTPEGLAKLRAELEHLRTVRRQEVAVRIQKAKEIGGTVDNAEYDEAKNEQAFVEGRILTLESMINTAVIIPDHARPSERVDVGSAVTVADAQGKHHTFVIVGSAEADPSHGKISNESPVGKALLGRRVKEVAHVATPSGAMEFTILSIR
ncbi:MAG: transcription elongation factor GreA [Chloroflexi bacterium]|nr:transcription elongation factor GreA [Chloroflexota bacterium]